MHNAFRQNTWSFWTFARDWELFYHPTIQLKNCTKNKTKYSGFKKFERNHEGLMGSSQLLLQRNDVLILGCFEGWDLLLAHRDNSFKLDFINFSEKGPHPMFFPFVGRDLCHLPIYRTVNGHFFIMKGFSPPPSPSHSCFLAPTVIHSPLCSALFAVAENLRARSQHRHDAVTNHKTDYLLLIYNVLKPIFVNSPK